MTINNLYLLTYLLPLCSTLTLSIQSFRGQPASLEVVGFQFNSLWGSLSSGILLTCLYHFSCFVSTYCNMSFIPSDKTPTPTNTMQKWVWPQSEEAHAFRSLWTVSSLTSVIYCSKLHFGTKFTSKNHSFYHFPHTSGKNLLPRQTANPRCIGVKKSIHLESSFGRRWPDCKRVSKIKRNENSDTVLATNSSPQTCVIYSCGAKLKSGRFDVRAIPAVSDFHTCAPKKTYTRDICCYATKTKKYHRTWRQLVCGLSSLHAHIM